MSERVKDDEGLRDIGGRTIIFRPVAIVEMTQDDKVSFRLHISELDPLSDTPKLWGITLSDMLDHLARACHNVTGRDERVIRAEIRKVMLDEDRFKERDPARGAQRGFTNLPPRN